ncbi:Alcohol O-acetyltransferase, partial [Homalodisca vitripennis]
DQTPTPTRFIRNCEEVGLFQDLQNVNPFEETFRKAVESGKTGTLALQLLNETALCKEADVFSYNKYLSEKLPKKKITPTLKIALEEAETHVLLNPVQIAGYTDEDTEEIFTNNPAEQSSIEVNEINSQLRYEKEKMESSLRLVEEEATEMCMNFEKEIASLRDQIKLLEKKLFKKDKELLELHNKLENYCNLKELNYLSPKILISTSTQTRKEASENKANEEHH